jgi:predicted O-methyltransferase YrrM
MLFLEYLRNQPIYRELQAVHHTNEGNLLEITDTRTAEAQIEFIRWATQYSGAHTYLEIGHNKGYFGYLLSQIVVYPKLTAIDINPDSRKAADILNRYDKIDVTFIEGSSIDVLPTLNRWVYDFIWLDGNHNYEFALEDLRNATVLQIPWIAIDDTNMGSVQKAIEDWQRETNIAYHEITNPFIGYDSRRARLYRKV